MWEVSFYVGHGLIVYYCSVRVIDGAVATYHELGRVNFWGVTGEEMPEFGVGFYKVGDTFSGVEAGYLDEVFLRRPF